MHPGGDEEERHEDAVARSLEVPVEEGVGHHPVAVDELEDGARDEGAEDRLDPEAVGQNDKGGQEQECASHSDLCRRVLKPAQRVGQPP